MKVETIYNGVGYYYSCDGQKVTRTYSTVARLRKYGEKVLNEFVAYWANLLNI